MGADDFGGCEEIRDNWLSTSDHESGDYGLPIWRLHHIESTETIGLPAKRPRLARSDAPEETVRETTDGPSVDGESVGVRDVLRLEPHLTLQDVYIMMYCERGSC